MTTTIRFSVKLFLAVCAVAVALGDPAPASAESYLNPSEWTMPQLHSHFNIRKKDLLEVRNEINKVRDELRTFRTASRDARSRGEYQATLRAKLRKLEQQEQRLLRDLRDINRAYQQRKATGSHAPRTTPSVPHRGTPVPSVPRPMYDPDTEYYLGLSRKMSEQETKELLGSFRKR